MRSDLKIVKIVLEELEKGNCVLLTGLCLYRRQLFARGIISEQESCRFYEIISDNKPIGAEGYWWVEGAKIGRKRFLNKLIKKFEAND